MINKRLREEREKAALTLEAVADHLGITRQAVGNWEAGRSLPDLNNLIAICRLYHTSADYILGLKSSARIDISALSLQEQRMIKDIILTLEMEEIYRQKFSRRRASASRD